MSNKNSIDTIENQTHDSSLCTAVPQPIVPPRALHCNVLHCIVQGDSKRWTHLNSKRRLNTHQTVFAVFQVLCSFYGLTCGGYAQNSLKFVTRSPVIQVVGRNFYLYTDSQFAQIGDSDDKCSSSLEVEC